MEKEKKSILKDALTDYNEIMEAAKANAKKKLAEEFPNEFQNLLKEELDKKNKKEDKESKVKLDGNKESKKLDESEANKESVMKEKIEETKKKKVNESEVVQEEEVQEQAGDGKPFSENPKKDSNATAVEEEAVEEGVKITDTVGKSDPFTEKSKKHKKVNETEAVEEQAGEGKPFTENPKKKGEAVEETVNENFDITELDAGSVGSAVDGAEEGDEFLTMEAIEEELAKMEEGNKSFMEKNPEIPKGNKGVAYTEKLQGLKNQIDEMLATLSEMHKMGDGDGSESYGTDSQIAAQHKSGPTQNLIDEENVEEMHTGGDGDGSTSYGSDAQIAAQHKSGPTDKLVVEENPITDDELNAVLNAPEGGVDEAMGMAHSSSKGVAGDHLPGKEFASHRHKRVGSANNESVDPKMGSLIEENKKLTKKLNETKKYKESASKLLESYKTALEKYRTQLKEMAVFNTNLAHVNNLLVNEELALTQDEKIKIISEFKKVGNITESQEKYKTFLNEMKDNKKNLSESIEEKVSTSVQPSSKQKLDEVVEKTAYENNEHVQRMKKLIEYVENRGKKIIK